MRTDTPSQDTREPQTLDVRSASQVLGVSDATLRRAIARGAFPVVRLPGIDRVLVSKREVDRLLRGTGAPEATTGEQPQLSAA